MSAPAIKSYIRDQVETISPQENEELQLEKQLNFEVQSTLGITCNVKLVGPREIERSEGKAARVVDKRRL
jgi:phenylacetate-CoA ligase